MVNGPHDIWIERGGRLYQSDVRFNDESHLTRMINKMVAQVGRLPVRGEVIAGPGNFEIEVLDADPRRVKRLRIGIRKERPTTRSPRERSRRDAAPETNAPPTNDNTPPSSTSGDGAGSQ